MSFGSGWAKFLGKAMQAKGAQAPAHLQNFLNGGSQPQTPLTPQQPTAFNVNQPTQQMPMTNQPVAQNLGWTGGFPTGTNNAYGMQKYRPGYNIQSPFMGDLMQFFQGYGR